MLNYFFYVLKKKGADSLNNIDGLILNDINILYNFIIKSKIIEQCNVHYMEGYNKIFNKSRRN